MKSYTNYKGENSYIFRKQITIKSIKENVIIILQYKTKGGYEDGKEDSIK